MKSHNKDRLDAAIRERMGTRRAFRHGLIGIGAALLTIAFVCMGATVLAGSDSPEKGVMTASLFAPLCIMGALREESNGDPDGGGDFVADPLAKKIIDGIKKTQGEMEAIEKSVAELGETKADAEELHKVIKNFDGLSADMKAFFQKSAQMETRLANIKREVSGDPLKRISEDDEFRALITAPAKAMYLRNKGFTVSKEIQENAARMADIISGKALTGGATPGSIVINQELVKTIYQLVASYGRWDSFDVMRPGTRTTKIPVDSTDPVAVWATEGAAPSEGSYAGSQVTLNIGKILVWMGVANELLEDDEIGLASHLAGKFARATAKKLDHACFVADGTADATHGDYEGIFEFGTAYALPTTVDSIAELTLAHFTGLVAGADEALAESENSRWWGHGQILVQLLNVKDDNGRPLFQTSMDVPSAGGIGSILGYSFIKTNLAPKTVAAEAPFLAFGDPNGLGVAVRSDFEMAASDQVKFTEDQTVFRGRMRAGVKIKQATAFEVMTFGAAS